MLASSGANTKAKIPEWNRTDEFRNRLDWLIDRVLGDVIGRSFYAVVKGPIARTLK